jgi:hypothetical protein
MNKITTVAAALLALALGAWGEKTPYELEHLGLRGDEWFPVATVHGYGKSNGEMCQRMAQAMHEAAKATGAPAPAKYRCVPNN